MPSYNAPPSYNTAYPELQNRIAQLRMENMMPSRLRQMQQFQGAAGQLGIDPYSFPGYGTQWGPAAGGWSDYGAPWSGTWAREQRRGVTGTPIGVAY